MIKKIFLNSFEKIINAYTYMTKNKSHIISWESKGHLKGCIFKIPCIHSASTETR